MPHKPTYYMNSYMLKGKDRSWCVGCDEDLTVGHILLDCVDLFLLCRVLFFAYSQTLIYPGSCTPYFIIFKGNSTVSKGLICLIIVVFLYLFYNLLYKCLHGFSCLFHFLTCILMVDLFLNNSAVIAYG